MFHISSLDGKHGIFFRNSYYADKSKDILVIGMQCNISKPRCGIASGFYGTFVFFLIKYLQPLEDCLET